MVSMDNHIANFSKTADKRARLEQNNIPAKELNEMSVHLDYQATADGCDAEVLDLT